MSYPLSFFTEQNMLETGKNSRYCERQIEIQQLNTRHRRRKDNRCNVFCYPRKDSDHETPLKTQI